MAYNEILNPMPIIDNDVSSTGTITIGDLIVAAPAGNGTLLSGASTSGSIVALACPGGDSAWIIQVTGTFDGGTVYWEGSVDSTNGTDGNWIALNGRQTGVINTVLTNNATAAGFYRGNTSGINYIRARGIGGTPSIAVKIKVSTGAGAIFLNASIPGGTNNIGTVNTQASQKATYHASTTAVLVAAVTATTPFFTIYGSATKTIRVQSITISGLTLTSVAYLNIGLRKYSSTPTGGTSTALTQVPLDSTSAAGTATTVNVYTAAPTVAGTSLGDVSSRRVIGQDTTAAAAGIPQIVDFDFAPQGDGTAIALRGTAEGIGLYWITAPATAVSMLIRVEYTEE